MDKDVAAAINAQLENAKDNLNRASCAGRRHDPSLQWGESGQTLQQIVDGYQAKVLRWEGALARVAT